VVQPSNWGVTSTLSIGLGKFGGVNRKQTPPAWARPTICAMLVTDSPRDRRSVERSIDALLGKKNVCPTLERPCPSRKANATSAVATFVAKSRSAARAAAFAGL